MPTCGLQDIWGDSRVGLACGIRGRETGNRGHLGDASETPGTTLPRTPPLIVALALALAYRRTLRECSTSHVSCRVHTAGVFGDTDSAM